MNDRAARAPATCPSAADRHDGAAERLWCRIVLAGALPSAWAQWFPDLTIDMRADGDTVLAGQLPDQAALHGICTTIRDLGLPVLELHAVRGRREPAQDAPS